MSQANDKDLKTLLAKVAETEIWEQAREGVIKAQRAQQKTANDVMVVRQRSSDPYVLLPSSRAADTEKGEQK